MCATFGVELWDYKLGPNDPRDPTALVGSWEIITEGDLSAVRYTYAGGSYNYTVHGSGIVGQTHSFCGSFDGGIDILDALMLPGQVACP